MSSRLSFSGPSSALVATARSARSHAHVAADKYGRAFTLGIEVDRVDELPASLHDDFSFEVPRGMHPVDAVSHHYPFAFTLPVNFYDVGLRSVIVGNEGSDVA